MYQAQGSAGSTPDYWDANWEQNQLEDVLADPRVCENSPCYRLLVNKLRPERLFLERGCGQAPWGNYFHKQGFRAVGGDFAARTVAEILQVEPDVDVRVSNILRPPFGNDAAQ